MKHVCWIERCSRIYCLQNVRKRMSFFKLCRCSLPSVETCNVLHATRIFFSPTARAALRLAFSLCTSSCSSLNQPDVLFQWPMHRLNASHGWFFKLRATSSKEECPVHTGFPFVLLYLYLVGHRSTMVNYPLAFAFLRSNLYYSSWETRWH